MDRLDWNGKKGRKNHLRLSENNHRIRDGSSRDRFIRLNLNFSEYNPQTPVEMTENKQFSIQSK